MPRLSREWRMPRLHVVARVVRGSPAARAGGGESRGDRVVHHDQRREVIAVRLVEPHRERFGESCTILHGASAVAALKQGLEPKRNGSSDVLHGASAVAALKLSPKAQGPGSQSSYRGLGVVRGRVAYFSDLASSMSASICLVSFAMCFGLAGSAAPRSSCSWLNWSAFSVWPARSNTRTAFVTAA